MAPAYAAVTFSYNSLMQPQQFLIVRQSVFGVVKHNIFSVEACTAGIAVSNKLIDGEWIQKGRRRIKYYSATKQGLELLNRVRELSEMPVKDFMSQT